MLKNNVTIFLIVMGLSAFNATTIFTVFLPFCENALHIPIAKGNQVFSVWLAVYFMTHIAAGYAGQKYFGYYRSIASGLTLAFIGVCIISFQSMFDFYLGLALFSMGASLYSTNIFAAFGLQFQVNDKQRSRAFLLLYVIMNLGAFFGDFASGFLINWLNYGGMFIVVSSPLLIAMFIFIFGTRPLKKEDSVLYKNLIFLLFVIVITLASLFLIMDMKSISILSLVVFLSCIAYLIIRNKTSAEMIKKNAQVFLLYSLIILGYWGMYMLYPSVVELYFEHHNKVKLWGALIQPSTISSFSPFFLIVTGFLLMMILRKYRDNVRTIRLKIGIALVALAIGFMVLYFGNTFYDKPYLFLAIVGGSYFFYALSEILIGPINFSMVGILIKPELVGIMLGFTYSARSVSGILTGQLASLAGGNYNHMVFMEYAAIAMFLALLLFVATYRVKE